MEVNKKKIFAVLLVFSGLLCFIYQLSNSNAIFDQMPSKSNVYQMNYKSKAVSTLKKLFNTTKYDAQPKDPNSVFHPLHNPYDHPFDINSTDIMVFLHVQKTGGSTFGRHLVNDLQEVSCTKRSRKAYRCLRPNDNTEWLFSRFSTGWKCGVHADWTSLNDCVPGYFERKEVKNPRYFYITIMREPVHRYLSEWLHVRRGATWKESHLKCNNQVFQYSYCWNGTDWTDVSLDEFINCDNNLANNRQTWMLADLRAINCTGKNLTKQELDHIMLETAKHNLKEMDFFGLTEKQEESQFLFEKTFNLHFACNFTTHSSHSSKASYTEKQRNKIMELNRLDIELYEFALRLFNERYRKLTGLS